VRRCHLRDEQPGNLTTCGDPSVPGLGDHERRIAALEAAVESLREELAALRDRSSG